MGTPGVPRTLSLKISDVPKRNIVYLYTPMTCEHDQRPSQSGFILVNVQRGYCGDFPTGACVPLHGVGAVASASVRITRVAREMHKMLIATKAAFVIPLTSACQVET